MLKLKKNQFRALGTDIVIQIVCDESGSPGKLAETFEEVKKYYLIQEKTFSRFDSKSELFRLNQNLGCFQAASYDIIEAAEKVLYYWKKTNGFFDPRIIGILENVGYRKDFKTTDFRDVEILENSPDFSGTLGDDLRIKDKKIYFGQKMDFSGIVKGRITDKVSKIILQRGFVNSLVDSGGDIRAAGKNLDRENWRISVEGLSEKDILLELDNDYGAVATSGISRKKWEIGGHSFHHLVNPKDPRGFSFDLRTVSAIGKTTEEADVWAKTLFLMGLEKGKKFSEENNLKSIFFDYRGNAWLSSRMKENISGLVRLKNILV